MGWEARQGGRRYLYRNYRLNGKPVKKYLATDDEFGFGEQMADDLDRRQRSEAKHRRLTRKARVEYRGRLDNLTRANATANADLQGVAHGILMASGYHRHNRGEWRMKRDVALLKNAIAILDRQAALRQPLVRYDAPANDNEAVELFTKARGGDAGALARVHALIREREWQDWIGNLGRQATGKLIEKAAGGDPVWEAGITQKTNNLWDELLGANSTVLEKILVRRVVNSWITTHVLELELTLRPPAEARDRAHLDRALSRAQRRMTEAARELARVRKLAAPALLTLIAKS